MPNLIDFDDYAAVRTDIYDKLYKSVKNVFPYKNEKYTLVLDNLNYSSPEKYSKKEQKAALLSGKSLNRKLTAGLTVIDNDTNLPVSKVLRKTLFNVPYYTERGTFIRNGVEYTVPKQFRLIPNIYTRNTASGNVEAQFNVRPRTGTSFRIEMDPATSIFSFKTSGRRIPLYPILKKLGIEDTDLINSWGKEIFRKNSEAKPSPHAISWIRSTSAAELEKTAEEGLEYEKDAGLTKYFGKMEVDPEGTLATLGTAYSNVGPEAILDSTRKILRVSRGEDNTDDRDSLQFQTVHDFSDFLSDKLKNDQNGVLRTFLWKLTGKQGQLGFMPSGILDAHTQHFFNNAGLAQYVEEISPMDMYNQNQRVVRLGEGAMGSIDVAPKSARAVQPSYLGLVDPVRSPESLRVGLDSYFARNVRKGPKNLLYAELLNAEGKKEWVDHKTLSTSVISFPGGLSSPSEFIPAMVKGKGIFYVPKNEVEYELKSGDDLFSRGANTVPFKSGVKGMRLSMGSRFINQALPLVRREAPYVQSTHEDGGPEMDYLGKFMGAIKAEETGTVTRVGKENIIVKTDSGEEKVYDLYSSFPFSSKTFIHNYPVVSLGDRVTKNKTLASSNFTDDKGTAAPGVNLKIGYFGYKGKNFEDATVISDSASKKLTAELMYNTKVERKEGAHIDKRKYMTLFPGKYTKDQLNKIGDNGVVEVGATVNFGDPLILSSQERIPSLSMMGRRSITDESKIWEHRSTGVITDVGETKNGFQIFARANSPALEGDKLSVAFGSKGVIAEVISDDKMPKDAAGNPLDIIFSPLSIVSRTNPSQLVAASLGKVAAKTGKSYALPGFSDINLIEFAKEELAKNGLTDTEDLTDPLTDKTIPKVFTGNMYVYRLQQTAESKGKSRSTGSYSQDEDPGRGGKGGCFPAMQKILTSDGEMLIGNIVEKRKRVHVWGYAEDAKNWGFYPVTDWFVREASAEDLLQIDIAYIKESIKNISSIYPTKNHMIYKHDMLKVRADELKVGDKLITGIAPGFVFAEIKDIKPYKHSGRELTFPVYDIEVSHIHKYTAGNVLVSNSKHVGDMEYQSLLAHGVTEVIKDLKLVKGQKNDDFWRQLKLGQTPTTPGTPLVYEKFKEMIRAAGVNLKEGPDRDSIFAATEDQIKELTGNREILSGATFSASKLEPIKCFDYSTLVSTEDGSKRIGEIVNKRLNIRVWSYNFKNKELELKPVIGWFRNKVKGLYEVKYSNCRFFGDRLGHTKLRVTEDHSIPDILGNKIPIKDAEYLVSFTEELSKSQEQVLYGTLLGEGSVSKAGNFSCSHQRNYINFKAQMLDQFKSAVDSTAIPKSVNKEYTCVRFKTRISDVFKDAYKLCYPNNIKTVSEAWLNKIDILGLAIWIMDDGTLDNSSKTKNLRICTDSFTESEQDLIVEWFNNKWDIAVQKYKYKDTFRIRVSGNALIKLVNLIAPYVLPDFQYSCLYADSILGSGLKSVLEDNKKINILKKVPFSFSEDMWSTKDRNKSPKTAYDITVKDNHNYISASILVGNSGLFDPEATGSLVGGERFAYISLPEPVLNPVMEGPIKSILGLDQKSLDSILNGEKEIAGKVGGEALKSLLDSVDINKVVIDSLEDIKTGVKSKRNAAIKRYGYARAMQKQGVDPKDFIITRVPVLPPKYRPITRQGNLILSNEPNYLYKALFDSIEDFKDSSVLPKEMQVAARDRVYKTYKSLVGLIDPIQPDLKQKQIGGILQQIFGKGSPKNCYDSETEILTEEGWLPIANYNGQVRVATIHPIERHLEYHSPTNIIHTPYVGEMVCLEHSYFSLVTTPEHRHFVKRRKQHGKLNMEEGWEIKVAKELSKGQRYYISHTASNMFGETTPPPFVKDAYAFASFVGLWAAEGWNHQDRYTAYVCQKASSVKTELIQNCVEKLGLRFSVNDYAQTTPKNVKVIMRYWGIHSKELVEWLKDNVGEGCKNKFLSANIRMWSADLARNLIEGYLEGDGCSCKTRKSVEGKTHRHTHGLLKFNKFGSMSKQLIEDMQILGIHAGIPMNWLAGGKPSNTGMYKASVVCSSYSPIEAKNIKRVNYNGLVHCVTVPNGLVIVRRNGKPCISGNSPLQRKVLGSNMDISGSAVVAPDPTLKLNQVGMPIEQAWELYEPFIIRKLVLTGVPATAAAKAVANKDKAALAALKDVVGERPVLVNRAPTLHKYSIMAFWPRLDEGHVLKVSPAIVGPFAMDFDGDSLRGCVAITYKQNTLNTEKILAKSNTEDGLDISNKKETCMSIAKSASIPTNIEVTPIERIPHIEETKIDKSENVTEWDVPEGVHICALDRETKELKYYPITKFSEHRNLKMFDITLGKWYSKVITTSEDHSLIGYKDGRIELLTPKEALYKMVPIAKSLYHYSSEDTLYNLSNSTASIYLDLNMGIFIGAMIGDGWVDNRSCGYIAASYPEFYDVLKDIVANSEFLGNSLPTYHTYSSENIAGKITERGKIYINGHTKTLSLLKEKIGVGFDNKVIPSECLRAQKKHLIGLLIGLLSTGGSIFCKEGLKRGKTFYNCGASYTTLSPNLRDSFSHLCKLLGIRSTISVFKAPSKKNAYLITLCKPDFVNFCRENPEFKMPIKHKQEALEDLLKYTDMSSNTALAVDKVPYPSHLHPILLKLNAQNNSVLRASELSTANKNGYISRSKALEFSKKHLLNVSEEEGLAFNIWRELIKNTDINWERVEDIKENLDITTAYDITVPGPFTFATSDGIIVQDTGHYTVPVSDKAVKDAVAKMLPEKNLISAGTYKPHYIPSQEYVMGLYYASKEPANKAVRKFNSKEDAEAAYEKGEIGIDDPIIIK